MTDSPGAIGRPKVVIGGSLLVVPRIETTGIESTEFHRDYD
jgi:hypothetical protein